MNPGELVITSINADDNDEFTFVPLVDLAGGTIIRFTDNGWLSSGAFRSGEGVLRYTAPSNGLMAGTKVGISKHGTTNAVSITAPTNNPGSVIEETPTNGFLLAVAGDQLIAFQGEFSAPTPLFALTAYRSSFDANAVDSNTSSLPATLLVGTSAIAIGTSTATENGEYNHSLTTGSVTQLRNNVLNPVNWNRSSSRISLNYTNFTLQIGNAPVFGNSQYNLSIQENSPVGTDVGSVTATDPDPGSTLVYSLTGAGSSNFVMHPATGAITVAANATLDFETNPVFSLTASVTDGEFVVSVPVQITLTDVANENNSPSIAPQTFIIHHKPLLNGLVGIVQAVDPNAGQSLVYSITGGNGGTPFIIEPSTGALRIANPKSLPSIPKGQTSVSIAIQVTVTDSGTPIEASSATITVTLSNTGIRMNPTVNPATFTLSENNKKTDGTTKVGAIKPLAAYSGQKFTFNALSGTDAASFNIDAKGGITLASGVSLNFETKPTYSFNVNVADSLDPLKVTTQAVTLNVKNLNEAPVYTLVDGAATSVAIEKGKAAIAIDENIPGNATKNGLVIATLTASDVDAGTTLALQTNAKNETIVMDKTGAFGYNTATGQISIIDETKVSFENKKAIKLSFIVTDDPIAGDPKSKAISTKLTVTVNLNDLNEAPVISSPTTFSVGENNKAGAKVGSVKAKDADTKAATKQTLTYSIFSQVDSTGGAVSLFSIDAKGGITIPTAGALNFEASPFYTLVVRVADSGTPGLFTDQTITINVLDLNEASSFALQDAFNAAASSLTISKSAINNNDKVGRLLISDVDAGAAGDYAPGAITAAVEAASKGALTYNELTGDLFVKDKDKLGKTFDLKLAIKDTATKAVTSKFTFKVNVIV